MFSSFSDERRLLVKRVILLAVPLAILIAAGWAFADGYSLVSWPCFGSQTVSNVFDDGIGGNQLTGGHPAANSDMVRYFDGVTWLTAWYKVGGPGPQHVWTGNLPTIESDKGYWVIIRTGHSPVDLKMWSDVPGPTTPRTIPIQPGHSFNFVGNALCLGCYLGGPFGASSGDGANLLASGFTGGYPAVNSDIIRFWDGTTWYSAYYKTTGPGGTGWRGQLASHQTMNSPYLEPGNGYILEVRTGHAFVGNTWTYGTSQQHGTYFKCPCRDLIVGSKMVSWPCPGANDIQSVFDDGTGGCQLTGGYPAASSDLVQYYDCTAGSWSTAWYKIGGPGPQNVWQGLPDSIDCDKGYVITIQSPVCLNMWAQSPCPSTTPRTTHICPGPDLTYVGWCACLCCYLGGAFGGQHGDGANLLASGFTGGLTQAQSDEVHFDDGTSTYTAWYHTTLGWQGRLAAHQTVDQPYFEPGNSYIIELKTGHAFVGNTWTYALSPQPWGTYFHCPGRFLHD
jgi:hypothetical protein